MQAEVKGQTTSVTCQVHQICWWKGLDHSKPTGEEPTFSVI